MARLPGSLAHRLHTLCTQNHHYQTEIVGGTVIGHPVHLWARNQFRWARCSEDVRKLAKSMPTFCCNWHAPSILTVTNPHKEYHLHNSPYNIISLLDIHIQVAKMQVVKVIGWCNLFSKSTHRLCSSIIYCSSHDV